MGFCLRGWKCVWEFSPSRPAPCLLLWLCPYLSLSLFCWDDCSSSPLLFLFFRRWGGNTSRSRVCVSPLIFCLGHGAGLLALSRVQGECCPFSSCFVFVGSSASLAHFCVSLLLKDAFFEIQIRERNFIFVAGLVRLSCFGDGFLCFRVFCAVFSPENAVNVFLLSLVF